MKLMGSKIRRVLLSLGIAWAVLISVQYAAAQNKVGYVLDISGEWRLGGGATLQRGSSLPGGAVVRTTSPNSVNTFIIIADLNGNIIAKKYCRDGNACNSPIQLPASASTQPSLISRLFNTVISFWGSGTVRYKTLGSRGAAGALKEAVVLLKDGKLDLTNPFGTLPADTYRLRLVEVPCTDLSRCKTVLGPVEFIWQPGKSAFIAASKLQPGIYEMQLLTKDTRRIQPTEIGTEAWVLVSSPASYKSAATSFAEAIKLTKSWDETMKVVSPGENAKSIKRTTVSSFLRATLDQLATETRIDNGSK